MKRVQVAAMVLRFVFAWLVIFMAWFFALEAGFRVFRHEKDPQKLLMQRHSDHLFKPGTLFQAASAMPGEFDYQAHINNNGYRGKDFEMPKPAGVKRIFAVGDSFTFGSGLNDDQTIPALLQQQLQAKGLAVEVVNAGVAGEGVIEHYMNLRNIHLRYEPDLVVLFFDLTDLWDDWNAERHAIYDAEGEIERFDPMFINGRRDWWATLTYHSVFLRYFHNKAIRPICKMNIMGVGGTAQFDQGHGQQLIEYDRLFFMRGKEREPLIREQWQRTSKYLLKTRDLLAAQKIPLVIVMYPHGIYVDGEQWNEGRKVWGFEQGKQYDDYLPFDLMEAFCRDNGIPFVNTLQAFLNAPKDKYFFDWDGHMTPKGAAVTASAVADSEIFDAAVSDVAAVTP